MTRWGSHKSALNLAVAELCLIGEVDRYAGTSCASSATRWLDRGST